MSFFLGDFLPANLGFVNPALLTHNSGHVHYYHIFMGMGERECRGKTKSNLAALLPPKGSEYRNSKGNSQFDLYFSVPCMESFLSNLG